MNAPGSETTSAFAPERNVDIGLGASGVLPAKPRCTIVSIGKVEPTPIVPLPTPEDFAGAHAALLETEELRFNGGWGAAPLDAARDACCFPSDSHACLHTHIQSREDLRASTKLLRAAGALSLIPGEGNFLRMEYRACVHAPDGGGRACA